MGPGSRRGSTPQHSQIRLRALTFGDEELSAGIDPRSASWRRSIARRRSLLSDATNAVRLVNAEGDELSGLVIDLYNDVAVAEVSNAGLERIKPAVIDILQRELRPRLIYFSNDLPARRLEQLSTETEAIGEGTPATTIVENGVRFDVDPREGQKTGFFLDQRENRRLARDARTGARVLNLFSYTGAFGVYAAAGGATFVENVDGSQVAIEQAKRNHDLNNGNERVSRSPTHSRSCASDARKQQVGLVICDPPAFAKRRVEVDRAARGYKDVNLYAMRLIEPGGTADLLLLRPHVARPFPEGDFRRRARCRPAHFDPATADRGAGSPGVHLLPGRGVPEGVSAGSARELTFNI